MGTTKQNKISRFLKNPFGLFKKKETIPDQKNEPPDPKPHQYDVLKNTVFTKSNNNFIDAVDAKEHSITNDATENRKDQTKDGRTATEIKDGETSEASNVKTKDGIVKSEIKDSETSEESKVKTKDGDQENDDSRSKNYSESSNDSGFLDNGKEMEKDEDEDDILLLMGHLSIEANVKRKPKMVTLSRGPIRNNGHVHSYVPYPEYQIESLISKDGDFQKEDHVNLITCSGGTVSTRCSQEKRPEVHHAADNLTQDADSVINTFLEAFVYRDQFHETPKASKNFLGASHGDLSSQLQTINSNDCTAFDALNGFHNQFDEFSVYKTNSLIKTSVDNYGANHQFENDNEYPPTAGSEDLYPNEYLHANECNYLNTTNVVPENPTHNIPNVEIPSKDYPAQSYFNPDAILVPTSEITDEINLVNDIINNKQEYLNIAVKLSQDFSALVNRNNVTNQINANNSIDDRLNIDQFNSECTIDLPNIEEFRIDYRQEPHHIETEGKTDINNIGKKAERYADPNSVSSSNEDSPILINIETPPNSVQDSCMFSPAKIEATVANTKKLNLPDFKRIQTQLDKDLSLECCNGNRDSCKELFKKYFAKLNDAEVTRMRKLVATQSLTSAHGFLMTIILKLHELAEVTVEDANTEIAAHMCKFYLVCLRVLEQDDTFFMNNDTGLVVLSAACRFCPHSPLLARFLVECARHQSTKRGQKTGWIFNEVDELGENLPMSLVRAGDECADVLNEIVRHPLFNIHHVNNEGCMALHIASKLHSTKKPLLRTVHVLLKHGNANLWAQEMKTNETAAHFAVNSNHSDINLVLLLFTFVQNGDRKRLARFKAVSDKSPSPLDYAKQKTRSNPDYPKEILEFLKKLR